MKKQSRAGLIKSAVQACARWAGIPIDAGDGTAFTINHTDGLYGGSIPTASVLKISAAWACVSLLSDTVGTLPLRLYEKTPTGRRSVTDHPLSRVLSRQPNTKMTAAKFLGATVATMLLRDAAYWEKQTSAGRVIGLNFLARDRLSISSKSDGTKEYRYTTSGKTRTIPESQIVKLINFTLDGENGLSAIQYGANMFGAAIAAETVAAKTFKKGLLQTIFFKYPTILKENQRNEARASIEKLGGAANAGETIIMEAGMESGTIGINPNDAQVLESRAFSVEEICSWFRMQPWMIGRASKGQTNWGTGIEQQMIGFVTFTLAPLLRVIEQIIEKDILLPAEKGRYYAEFSIDGLLRGDSAARREFYASAVQNGWMNRNQVRALENQDPFDGGEIFTVQSNLIPVDQLGQTKSADVARDALKLWLGVEQKEPAQCTANPP
jgi:HK97 family phage portal protein